MSIMNLCLIKPQVPYREEIHFYDTLKAQYSVDRDDHFI